jgi:hypothetical protein
MVENSDNGFQLLVDSISVAISSARHKIATLWNKAKRKNQNRSKFGLKNSLSLPPKKQTKV